MTWIDAGTFKSLLLASNLISNLEEIDNLCLLSKQPLSIEQTIKLDCGHKFCTECLYKWLGNHIRQTASTCPLCREKYKLDNIRITSSTNVLTRSMLITHREEDFVLNLCKKSYRSN